MGILNNTHLIAWWGALTGTSVLIWDVLKWVKSGPKLKIRIQPHTVYMDSEVCKVEKTEDGGEAKTLKTYHHIEIVNVGDAPTTILNIQAGVKKAKFPDWKDYMVSFSYSSQAFAPHFDKKLPQVVHSGEVWSCRLPDEYVQSFFNRGGEPRLFIYVGHRDKPLVKKLRKSSERAR